MTTNHGGSMDAKTLERTLRKMGACGEAREWARGKTLAQVWAECPRGDWMLWLAAKADVDRKAVVLAACACARLALPHVTPDEGRPLKAIETAEAWARAESGVTLEDVRKAASAASAAASAASAASAAYAAYAAASAAYAAYAAASAAASAARQDALMRSAGMVREMLPLEVVEAALRARVTS